MTGALWDDDDLRPVWEHQLQAHVGMGAGVVPAVERVGAAAARSPCPHFFKAVGDACDDDVHVAVGPTKVDGELGFVHVPYPRGRISFAIPLASAWLIPFWTRSSKSSSQDMSASAYLAMMPSAFSTSDDSYVSPFFTRDLQIQAKESNLRDLIGTLASLGTPERLGWSYPTTICVKLSPSALDDLDLERQDPGTLFLEDEDGATVGRRVAVKPLPVAAQDLPVNDVVG